MKSQRILTAVVVAAVLAGAAPVRAQVKQWLSEERKEWQPPPPEEGEKKPEEMSFFERYMKFMDRELEKASDLDLVGVSSQLPFGYFSVKWQMDIIKADQRFNANHRRGPLLVLEDVPAPLRICPQYGSLDLGLGGHGGGHTFQISYGITDPLNWYMEIPFSYMNVGINPVWGDGAGHTLDGSGFLRGLTAGLSAEQLKVRPPMGRKYSGKWQLGDINTGFSWNIFRNYYFSGALTARVFFPTGHLPSPNNNLTYATGPEIEIARGGWAVGATQGYDLRLYKYSYWLDLILSSELTVTYAFEQDRKYPSYMIDLNAIPVMFKPLVRADGTPVKGTFQYTPGWSLDWSAELGINIAMVGFSAGFGVSHSQMPELKGDDGFIQRVQELQLIGTSTIWAVKLGVNVSLLPLYVPVEVGFSWQKVVDGMNAIIYDNYFQIAVKGYIPAFPK